VRFPPPFRERHRRNNVGGEEVNDPIDDEEKTVVVILGVSLSLLPLFTAQSFAESLVVGTTTTTFRSREIKNPNKQKKTVFRQKAEHISIPARSIGYSTTRSWNTITRARNVSFDCIRARIFRRRRQRNREKEVLSGNNIFDNVSNQIIFSSGTFSRAEISAFCAPERTENVATTGAVRKEIHSRPKKEFRQGFIHSRLRSSIEEEEDKENAHLVG